MPLKIQVYFLQFNISFRINYTDRVYDLVYIYVVAQFKADCNIFKF